jgi:hypothetical protein
MKKRIMGALLVLICCGFVTRDTYRQVRNESFGRGEILEYRVHYGFINAAEAVIEVHKDLFKINNRPCYRVNVAGKTIGGFDLVLRIRDTWRSYIDTAAIIPHRFQDLISGYYYLRTIDFNQLRPNDVVAVDAFFDDEYYDFKVRYRGKGEVDTKWGKLRCILLNPIMPANQLFKGENSIKVWLSDDQNKMPVKVEAEMFVGAVELDLKKYKNVRHEPKFYK